MPKDKQLIETLTVQAIDNAPSSLLSTKPHPNTGKNFSYCENQLSRNIRKCALRHVNEDSDQPAYLHSLIRMLLGKFGKSRM